MVDLRKCEEKKVASSHIPSHVSTHTLNDYITPGLLIFPGVPLIRASPPKPPAMHTRAACFAQFTRFWTSSPYKLQLETRPDLHMSKKFYSFPMIQTNKKNQKPSWDLVDVCSVLKSILSTLQKNLGKVWEVPSWQAWIYDIQALPLQYPRFVWILVYCRFQENGAKSWGQKKWKTNETKSHGFGWHLRISSSEEL